MAKLPLAHRIPSVKKRVEAVESGFRGGRSGEPAGVYSGRERRTLECEIGIAIVGGGNRNLLLVLHREKRVLSGIIAGQGSLLFSKKRQRKSDASTGNKYIL